MAFKLRKCKGPDGLPLIEIPDGKYFYERLSPGTIREPDFYDLFRKVRRGSAEVLVACPRGEVKSGRCKVPLRVLRIRHKKAGLKKIMSECKAGELARRRANEIRMILKDVGRELSGSGVEEVGNFVSKGLLITLAVVGIISIVIER